MTLVADNKLPSMPSIRSICSSVVCFLLLINLTQSVPAPDCTLLSPPSFLDIVRKHVDIDVVAILAKEYLSWPREITVDTPDWELKKVIKALGKQRIPDVHKVIEGINKEFFETVETWTKVCQTQTVGRRRRSVRLF